MEELAMRVALVRKNLMFIRMMRMFIRMMRMLFVMMMLIFIRMMWLFIMMMSRGRIRIETCRQESHLLKSFNNTG